MKPVTILVLLFFIINSLAFGQSEKTIQNIDGTLAIGKNEGSLSFQYVRLWSLTKKNKLYVGLGARLTSYVGTNQYYITAPAEITSGSTGPFVIFKENIIQNIDSFLVKSPSSTALNISINIQYKLNEKFTAGFNIDAIGFTIGGAKTGNYINGDTNTGGIVKASPTKFNALLISDNDLGTLNSELFLKYQIREKLGLKLGATFLFTEYTTDFKVQTFPEENDRFRRKSLMLGLGVSYKL